MILNWDVLDNDDNINENRSVNQQDKVNKKIESAAEKYISTSLKSKIEKVFDGICAVSSDNEDKHILLCYLSGIF